MVPETSGYSVLLVEDDPDYSQLLHEAFAEAGFRTLVAGNGERALDILRRQNIDLVVSDFVMPELNGLELCRLLAEDLELSKQKVILYSCNTDAAFRRKARELGALDYLPKSDDTTALVKQICALAGINHHDGRVAANEGNLEEVLRLVSNNTGQLRLLFETLFDFTKILAMSEQPSPAMRLAWDAAQRTGGDIKRVLSEMERLLGAPALGAPARAQGEPAAIREIHSARVQSS